MCYPSFYKLDKKKKSRSLWSCKWNGRSKRSWRHTTSFFCLLNKNGQNVVNAKIVLYIHWVPCCDWNFTWTEVIDHDIKLLALIHEESKKISPEIHHKTESHHKKTLDRPLSDDVKAGHSNSQLLSIRNDANKMITSGFLKKA